MSYFFSFARLFMILIITLVLLSIHSWVNFVQHHFSFIGATVEVSEQDQYIVKEIYPNGEAIKSDLRIGDIVLINQHNEHSYQAITKFHHIEKIHSLFVQRDNQLLNFHFSPTSSLSLKTGLYYIGEIVYFIIGIYTITRQQLLKKQLLMSANSFCISIAFSTAKISNYYDQFALVIYSIVILIIPSLFILYVQHAINKAKGPLYLYSKIVLGITLVYASLKCITLLPSYSYTWYKIDTIGMSLHSNLMYVSVIALYIYIYSKHRQHFNQYKSYLLAILIIFTLCMLPFAIFTLTPSFYLDSWLGYNYFSYTIILFPVIHLILKYQSLSVWIIRKWKRKLSFSYCWVKARLLFHKKLNQLLIQIPKIQSLASIKFIVLIPLVKKFLFHNVALCVEKNNITDYISVKPLEHSRINLQKNTKSIATNFHLFNVINIHEHKFYLIVETKRAKLLLPSLQQQTITALIPALALILQKLYFSEVNTDKLGYIADSSNFGPAVVVAD